MRASLLPISRIRDAYVMSCRCGKAMRLIDMHRLEPPRDTPADSLVVRRIVRLGCALSARAVDEAGAA